VRIESDCEQSLEVNHRDIRADNEEKGGDTDLDVEME